MAAATVVRALRRLHRYVGLLAAVFVLWLAVSGLLLQHAPVLDLHNRFVTNAWLLSFYDVRAPARVLVFNAGDVPVVQVDERIFLGPERVRAEVSTLQGALSAGHGSFVIALTDGLMRVNAQAEVVDRIGALEGLQLPILQLGRGAHGVLIVRSERGLQQVSEDFVDVSVYAGRVARFSLSKPLAPVPEALSEAYRDGIISVERLIADMHAGRLPGGVATALIDLAALALILLAVSGLYMFARMR